MQNAALKPSTTIRDFADKQAANSLIENTAQDLQLLRKRKGIAFTGRVGMTQDELAAP